MIENVLTRLLFKYAGPESGLFHKGERLPIFACSHRAVLLVSRPAGAVGFAGTHYHRNHPAPIESVDFSDASPDCYEANPNHPWRVQIRGELVELFDLILGSPSTELLYTCDPTGAEIEKELKHLRRFDP
mgnify:CR=1 FL=1